MVAKDYDAVITFVASSQLTAPIAGKYIAQKLGCKFGIYAVDAIPAPGGWIRHKYQFKSMQKLIGKVYSAADYVTASNAHMLEYQLTQFKHKKGLETDVLLTPGVDGYYNNPPSDEVVFLYAGALYGLRNPDHFIKAFKRLLKIYPKAEFCIVGGVYNLRNIDEILTPEERTHVVTLPRTYYLEPLFARAKVLVDIDADLDKDPFLSSKIVTYLKVNRVILSETGKITPSREMFVGLNTVVQCDHNEESLYQGMLRAIEVADSNPDFSERNKLIEDFSVEKVSEKLWRGLQRVCGVKE
jgi:glycosyltransferase involved in cell wall biosynthesis